MVRKLASVLLSLAAISPTWVNALGLGEIQLNSFLNQPLDAQIEILSLTKGESDGMQVKLASPEAFERAGLEFSNNLRQLKFTINSRSNGKQYIKVTTRKGFREPFLNFLLEVNWANGRILREYAELVDPPSLVKSQATSVAASTPSSSTRQSAPKPPLYGAQGGSSVSTIDQADTGGYIGDTYTTKRNDTAWQIANDTRADGSVSVEQSMMALLRANPDAFIRQNINRLKAGYVLNIPDRDSMLSQSHSDAQAEVRQQTREWRNRNRTQTAAAPKGHLEILPPQTEATGQEQASGTASGSQAELNREVMLAREATEAQRQENAELRLRVSELEEQINNDKRLAQLKADQMAALEKKLGEINAAPDVPVTPTDIETEIPVAEEAPQETEVAETVEEPVTEEPEQVAVKEKMPLVEAVPAPPGTPINQHVVTGFTPVDLNALPKSELPAQPFKTGGAPEMEAEESGSIIDQALAYFKQNPIIKWIAAGAGALVVLLFGLMMARRRSGDEQFEESILHEQAAEETNVQEESATIADADTNDSLFETVDIEADGETDKSELTDSSFLSDMVLSDMSDMQGEGGESDPLTEADVFLAYGRFGPAENMIKGAIEKEPKRNDLKLKLLEIYYSSKNKDAFEQTASDFHDELESNPDTETWDKVAEMGEDLCPDNALFAVAGAAAGAAIATDAISDQLDDMVSGSEEDTEVMDFDLSEFEDQIDELGVEDDSSLPVPDLGDDSLDLDLGDLTGEENEAEENLERTVEITKNTEEAAKLGDMPADQDDFLAPIDASDEDITQEIESNVSTLNPEITQELDIPDLDDGLDLSDASDMTLPIDDDLDMDDDALADIDEVGTKLDLARAYIDMGDPEGARSILDEVIEEGDAEQQGEAKKLLEQI